MKKTTRISIYLALGILLSACGQFTLRPASALPEPTATLDLAAIRTEAAATAFVELTKMAAMTATPSPSMTLTAMAKPTSRPQPTLFPPIDATKLPGMLQSALSVETLNALNGHNLRRITGWSYGFDGFEWMNTTHLLARAIIGPKGGEAHFLPQNYPAAVDLNFGKAWIPKSASLSWSERLQKTIVVQKDMVEIYSLDGELEKAYPGSLLGFSPSGTKMLFKDGTWFDLVSGKRVHFDWDQKYIDEYYHRPVWSESENRVYVCCHLYGDAKTGDSYLGRGGDAMSNGVWILNDKYLMRGCCDNMLFGGPPTFFDVSTKTFHYLSELISIPMGNIGNEEENQCIYWFISPNGKNVWLVCSDNNYLVDFITLKFTKYPPHIISDIQWSANGNFALIDDSLSLNILSVNSKELKPLPADSQSSTWHPTDNILAYLTNKGQTLSLLDARIMSVQKEAALPAAFQDIIWSPDGKHIALLARDSSLWQIDYPKLDNLEQLTPAMPKLTGPVYGIKENMSLIKNVTWSPDGTFLAFIGDLDIYIVDTQRNP